MQNLQSWYEKIAMPNASRLEGPLLMETTSIDIVGHKAFVEAVSDATMKNGKPYNNRCVYVLVTAGREVDNW